MHKISLKAPWLLALLLVAGCSHAQTAATPDTATSHTTSQTSQLGMNLSGVNDWATELPFVDVFRSARTWTSQKKGEKWGGGPELNLDEHGWVKSLEPDSYVETPFLNTDPANYPQGKYTLIYEGEGQIELKGVGKIAEEMPGRIVFELTPQNKFKTVRILSVNPAKPIRAIHILMPGTEATYRTNPWNPVFFERWKNFNTLRFMDWMRTNNSEIKEWNERPQMEDATWTKNGVPLEMMIDLCNRLGVNAWFCMPHQASDDYVRQFAQQVKKELKPGLKSYVEYSNEVWNTGFKQTKWAGKKGVEMGFSDKDWEGWWRYSSYRSVQIFKIWEEVFGGHDRFVRVMATQAAVTTVSKEKLAFQDAYKYCDALASAPYFGMNISVRDPKKPDNKIVAEDVAAWTTDQLLDELERTGLPKSIDWMQKQKAIADGYKLQHIAYEGGQHLVGLRAATNNKQLTELLAKANRSERMGEFYKRYLDAWRASDSGLFAVFASVSSWGKSGSWGLLESNGDTTPKYESVIEWNQNHPVLATKN